MTRKECCFEKKRYMSTFSNRESFALNFIRWLSAIAIVVCHFLQYYGNIWAWVFNVGVQIFFFLSGFLYGIKRIADIKKFYKGRVIKLYIPYVLWTMVAILLLGLFHSDSLTMDGVIKQFIMIDTLPGLTHLWFMPVIFLCYLILPFFDRLLSKNEIIGLMSFVVIALLLLVLMYSPNLLWVILYFVGYLCGRYNIIQIYLFAMSLIMTCCIIIMWYTNSYHFFIRDTGILNNLLHAFAGIFIFLGLYLMAERISFNSNRSGIVLLNNTLATGGGMSCISRIICLY